MSKSSLKTALDKGAKFFIENKKIVDNMYKIYCYNDEPKLYQYTAYFLDKNKKVRNYDSVASGVSFYKNKALIKLFGETMERYALSTNTKIDTYSSYNAIRKSGLAVLNPKNQIFFTAKNSYKARILDEKIYWVKATSLKDKEEILIPAQLIYVPYVYQEKESLIQFPISTGAAAGTSVEEALSRAIFEVIERDSFMVHYLNKLNSRQISIEQTSNLSLKRILNAIRNYNLELYVMDLMTDIGIKSVAAIIIDKTGLGPAVSVGLKAGTDQIQNITGAIEEAMMVRYWIRDEFGYLKRGFKLERRIRTVEQRAKYWYPLKTINYLNFWFGNENKVNIEHDDSKKSNNFKDIIASLLDKKIEIYYVDLTTKEIARCGFKVVKVIIPQLQPLYLDESYPYLYSARLHEAPVSMGYIKNKKKRKDLNKIPHPFL